MHSDRVAGLLHERKGYLARGLVGKVADVDAQLAIHGYVDPPTSPAGEVDVPETATYTPPPETTTPPRPRGRPRKGTQ